MLEGVGKQLTFAALLLIWLVSGCFILYVTEISPPQKALEEVKGLPKVVYGVHVATWMLVGMLANYLWDLFRRGGTWSDILLRDVFIPFLIAPIVFYSIWSLWGSKITFGLCLVAFQNGFFWQVVFSKAGPISQQVASANASTREG
jgi:hypothetical protein